MSERGGVTAIVSLVLVFAVFSLAVTAYIPRSQWVGLPWGAPVCPTSRSTEVNGSAYGYCNQWLNWAGVGVTPVLLANMSFHSVRFTIYGNTQTWGCPVVNLTGTEANHSSSSVLLYGAPYDCNSFRPSMKFASDLDFGANWTGGNVIQLLVRMG